MREVWEGGTDAGSGCAGYMVLVGAAAVHDLGLAAGDAGPGGVLSDELADHGLRHPVLLGGEDDHDGLPFYGGAASSAGGAEGRECPGGVGALSRSVYTRAGEGCRAPEDVEDQGKRAGSDRGDREVRHGRNKVYA